MRDIGGWGCCLRQKAKMRNGKSVDIGVVDRTCLKDNLENVCGAQGEGIERAENVR